MATKYKRGSLWWARAQRNGKEFRQSLKTRDRRLAEERLQQWVRNLDALAWGDRPRVTFREAIKQFIEQHVSTLKVRSAKRYGVSIKWLNDTFGEMYVDQISRASLAEYEAWRRSMNSRTRKGQKVSSPTIRRDLACLSSLLTFCEEREWIEEGKNPVRGFLRRRSRRGLKEAPPRQRYLSEREEAALLDNASDALRVAVMLAIDTGLREQEMFSLRWHQIDFRRGVVATTTDTKNGRIRKVPLAQRSAQALERMKSTPASSGVRSLYVFAHLDGSRYMNMTKGFKAAAKRAGIADLRWHDLRRTAGCRWRQRDGVKLEEVSVLLGHSSYIVTEKCYAFLDNSDIAEGLAAQKSAHQDSEL